MRIQRDIYLNRLIIRKHNGMAKAVTGIRRCGKSYLLFELFKEHLLSEGVEADHILEFSLDDLESEYLQDAHILLKEIKDKILDDKMYYVLIDEVQLVDKLKGLINSLIKIKNADIYVTGSNSKMLSSDIVTELRGRLDEVRVRPLSFSEFAKTRSEISSKTLTEYMDYGGMPRIAELETEEEKVSYLNNLNKIVYLRDVSERHSVKYPAVLENVMNTLSSSVGSLTSVTRLKNTMNTSGFKSADEETIKKYIEYLEDAFLFEKAQRYDVKGNRYTSTPQKYYMVDPGLRNSFMNFRQVEYPHLMENVIYNELRTRGYTVDVGLIEIREKDGDTYRYKQIEVDFIANKGSKRYYIQSAFSALAENKVQQEIRPFLKIKDSFKKIMVVGDDIPPHRDQYGIVTMGILEFLMNENSLDF